MISTSTVTARVPREVKRQAEIVLKRQGLTPTEVINRLYEKIIALGTFPEDTFPNMHAFPEPGERVLDAGTLNGEQSRMYEAFLRHKEFKVEFPVDFGYDYKRIIAEGRRKDYEALS